MQMCQLHWAALRDAIKERGLDHLVAQSGLEAVEYLKREIEGTKTLIEYDPLMSANGMIWNLAVHVMGLQIIAPDEEGKPQCPVCALQSYDYISAAADGALHHARKTGLVTSEVPSKYMMPDEEADS